MRVEVLHSFPEVAGEQGVIGFNRETSRVAFFYDLFEVPAYGPGLRLVEVVRQGQLASTRLVAPVRGIDSTAELDCEEPTPLGDRLFGDLPVGCFGPDLSADLLRLGRITAEHGVPGVNPASGMAVSADGRVVWLPTERGCFEVDLPLRRVVAHRLRSSASPVDPFLGFDAHPGPGHRWLMYSARELVSARSGQAPAPIPLRGPLADARRLDAALFRSHTELLVAYAIGTSANPNRLAIVQVSSGESREVARLPAGRVRLHSSPNRRHIVVEREPFEGGPTTHRAIDVATLALGEEVVLPLDSSPLVLDGPGVVYSRGGLHLVELREGREAARVSCFVRGDFDGAVRGRSSRSVIALRFGEQRLGPREIVRVTWHSEHGGPQQ